MKSTTAERLRQVAADPFIGDAVMADYLIEAADEIDSLRAALAGLVRVYVIDGAATTPASEIGNAWEAAQRALLRA
jgi:hypothetical protein